MGATTWPIWAENYVVPGSSLYLGEEADNSYTSESGSIKRSLTTKSQVVSHTSGVSDSAAVGERALSSTSVAQIAGCGILARIRQIESIFPTCGWHRGNRSRPKSLKTLESADSIVRHGGCLSWQTMPQLLREKQKDMLRATKVKIKSGARSSDWRSWKLETPMSGHPSSGHTAGSRYCLRQKLILGARNPTSDPYVATVQVGVRQAERLLSLD